MTGTVVSLVIAEFSIFFDNTRKQLTWISQKETAGFWRLNEQLTGDLKIRIADFCVCWPLDYRQSVLPAKRQIMVPKFFILSSHPSETCRFMLIWCTVLTCWSTSLHNALVAQGCGATKLLETPEQSVWWSKTNARRPPSGSSPGGRWLDLDSISTAGSSQSLRLCSPGSFIFYLWNKEVLGTQDF